MHARPLCWMLLREKSSDELMLSCAGVLTEQEEGQWVKYMAACTKREK